MRNSESLAVEWRSIGQVRPYPGNPRKISEQAIEKVATSIKEFGWRQPIVIDEAGEIVVGHTRFLAAKRLGLKRVPAHVALGLSPDAVRAYRLADNRTHEEASWDLPALHIELKALDVAGFDVSLTGFDPTELEMAEVAPPPTTDEAPEQRGKLLSLVNIAIGEPKNQVAKGDHFELGERHHLFCVGVMTDWPVWAPLLAEGMIFCPYPGPFVPYGEKVVDHALLMVQPDPYTAGHVLDRFAEIHGADSIRKVTP